MLYLESLTLPDRFEETRMLDEKIYQNGGYIDNSYPCHIFPEKGLSQLWFRDITILYGGNSSGKSTLLNIIAEKLKLQRMAPFNTGEMFDNYVEHCEVTFPFEEGNLRTSVPEGSGMMTSDDIFDYMLAVRGNNEEIAEETEKGRSVYRDLKYGDTLTFHGMEDYDVYRLQVLSRRKSLSRRNFIRKTAGEEVRLRSNGETALNWFNMKLLNDRLYCLDEPENSMSPSTQMMLMEILETQVRYCGCQLILATHSPFLLALPNARIYDLDSDPVEIRNWWELENVRVTWEFFDKNRRLFERTSGRD